MHSLEYDTQQSDLLWTAGRLAYRRDLIIGFLFYH